MPLKHTYIDAFKGRTVTRETLIRYTFKSHLVNVLIRGFLWKTPWLRFKPTPPIGRSKFVVASVFSHAVAALGTAPLLIP